MSKVVVDAVIVADISTKREVECEDPPVERLSLTLLIHILDPAALIGNISRQRQVRRRSERERERGENMVGRNHRDNMDREKREEVEEI